MVSFDRPTFGRQPHPQRVELYTCGKRSQRLFVTNPTKSDLLFTKLTLDCVGRILRGLFPAQNGQVAQLVERGPEKAGVGGSIPSLATNNFNNLAKAKNHERFSRAQYASGL